jgi:O-antigen/teichoic acid export membrane protein
VAAHLTQKLVRGIPWAIGESFFNVLYGLLTVVVIGRFIAPAELGAASTATAAVFLIEVVSSAGILEAVVRSRSGDTLVTDTAFVMAMVFALLAMWLCALTAFPIAAMFGDDRLISLMIAASFLLPLNAFAAVPSAIMSRKMRASKLTRRVVGGRVLGLLTLSILAATGCGAWSLILSNLATSFGSLSMILMASKRWPHIRLAWQEVPALLRFGVMISTEFVLYTITARAFSLLFGYFHGLAPLGNFQFAWRLCDEVAALVETSVNRFGLSFFAGKERMSADTTSSFLTGSQIITAVTTPVFSGIALVANDFVPLVFGSRWELAIPFLQILALSSLIVFQRVLTEPAFRARGHQTALVRFAGLGTAFALISCLATANLPPIYGVISFAARQLFVAPFIALAIDHYLHISLKAQFGWVIGPTTAAAIMAAAVISFQLALPGAHHLFRLIGSVLIGVAAYAIPLWFLSPALVTSTKSLLLRHAIRG